MTSGLQPPEYPDYERSAHWRRRSQGAGNHRQPNFDHTINGRKFSGWIRAAGYQYEMVGENLAIDFASSEGVVRAWMNSPEHRANLLENSYADIGVGIAEGKFQGENTIVVAELFGDPLYKNPPIPENISRLHERFLPWNNSAPANYYLFTTAF